MFKKLKSNNRWNAVCDESRMHGVERGKRWRLYQNLTYRYNLNQKLIILVGTMQQHMQRLQLIKMELQIQVSYLMVNI